MSARRAGSEGSVRLFANRFEQTAFWASVAGLALVLASLGLGIATPDRDEHAVRVAEQTRQIAELRAELAAVQAQLDSLQAR